MYYNVWNVILSVGRILQISSVATSVEFKVLTLAFSSASATALSPTSIRAARPTRDSSFTTRHKRFPKPSASPLRRNELATSTRPVNTITTAEDTSLIHNHEQRHTTSAIIDIFHQFNKIVFCSTQACELRSACTLNLPLCTANIVGSYDKLLVMFLVYKWPWTKASSSLNVSVNAHLNSLCGVLCVCVESLMLW